VDLIRGQNWTNDCMSAAARESAAPRTFRFAYQRYLARWNLGLAAKLFRAIQINSGFQSGPKDQLLALLEQNAVRQQKLLSEFQAALEAARMNAAAFDEGTSRIKHSLAAGRLIAWLSLMAAVVFLTAPSLCA
jgi:uncharacterized tellurite resistance protein B-like protein